MPSSLYAPAGRVIAATLRQLVRPSSKRAKGSTGSADGTDMIRSPQTGVGGPADLRTRIESVRVGSRLVSALAATGVLYAGLTWHGDHRPLMVAILLAAVPFGHVPVAVGRMRKRWAAMIA